jgi:hypothetical protein
LTAIIFSTTNEGEKIIVRAKMLATRIYREVWEIDARLEHFGVTRAELIEIVRGVVGARADAVENDPATAEGLFAYIFGTRFLRSLFRMKGYLLFRHDNIEGVEHAERPLKIIYQNVDSAALLFHNPRAVSSKGSASDRVVDAAQGSLFTEEELAASHAVKFDRIDTGVWYFCVSVNGDDVRAELSLPTRIDHGNFAGFIERIFIVGPDDWGGLRRKSEPGSGGPAEFEPVVTRK